MTYHDHPADYLRLGVNIDHVATIRNARGGRHPDPVKAAHLAVAAGADGITAHLREDRRHISDNDIARLKAELDRPLNLEMAATAEMLKIALGAKPNACCLVPERREERTTEGGLNVHRQSTSFRPSSPIPCLGVGHCSSVSRSSAIPTNLATDTRGRTPKPLGGISQRFAGDKTPRDLLSLTETQRPCCSPTIQWCDPTMPDDHIGYRLCRASEFPANARI